MSLNFTLIFIELNCSNAFQLPKMSYYSYVYTFVLSVLQSVQTKPSQIIMKRIQNYSKLFFFFNLLDFVLFPNCITLVCVDL